MSVKPIITVVLLLFVVIAIGWLVYDGMRKEDEAVFATTPPAAAAATADPAAAPMEAEATVESPRVVAYYFHRTKRCPTCMKIARYAPEALERGFAEELASGALELRVVNLDEQRNGHFIEDFELSVQAVVLSEEGEQPPQRWKNLTQVWDLVGDKAGFLAYIRKETRAFLHEG